MFTPGFSKVNTVSAPFRGLHQNLKWHQMLNDSQSILFSLFALRGELPADAGRFHRLGEKPESDAINAIASNSYKLYRIEISGVGAP